MHDTTSLLPREDPPRAADITTYESKKAEFFSEMLCDTDRFEIGLVKYLKQTLDRNLAPESKMAILKISKNILSLV